MEKRHGDRNRQRRHPVGAEPSLFERECGHDQPKFAVLSEGQAGQHGRTSAHFVAQEDEEERCAFDGQKERQQERNADHRQRGLCRQADRQEKPDQEDVLEAHDRLGKLPRLRVASQQHAEHERAQIGLHPHQFEESTTGGRENDTREDQNLVVSAGLEQQAEERTGKIQERQGQRPDRGYLAGGGTEEDHRHDVLDNQDAHCQLAMAHAEFATLFQHCDRANGGAETQGKGDEHRLLPTRIPHQDEPEDAEQRQESHRDEAEARRVLEGRTVDFRLDEAPNIQLQADDEEHQRDPCIGEEINDEVGVEAQEAEAEARNQVLDQRLLTDLARGKPASERSKNDQAVEWQGSSSSLPTVFHTRGTG